MTYTKPFDFTNGAGNTIDADEVNDNFDTLYTAVNTIEAAASATDTLAGSLRDAWRPGRDAGAAFGGPPSATTYLLPWLGGVGAATVGGSAFLAHLAFPLTAAHYESGSLNAEGRVAAWMAENATSSAVTYTFGLYTVTGIGGASGGDVFISAVSLVAGSQTPALSAGGNLTDNDLGSAFTIPAGPSMGVLGVVVSGAGAANSRPALMAELQRRAV